MTEIITNLHPDGDENTNLYPNIKKENIPSKSISTDKLDDNVLSLIGSLKPSGTDTSANILGFTSNKGIYVATDNGHWYYWNGTNYVDGGIYITDPSYDELKKYLDTLSDSVAKIQIDYWNEIEAGNYEELKENTFINNNIENSNSAYYSYIFIKVKPNTLYRFYDSEYGSGQARFVNLYDGSKNFISCSAEIFNITTPSNCEYMSVSFAYVNGTSTKGTTYVTTHDADDHVNRKNMVIPNDYTLPEYVINKGEDLSKAEHRQAVINFIFDDGNVKDADIVNIFKNKKAICGFAILSSNTRLDEYLNYQRIGFEILSHSTDSNPMENDSQTIFEIEEKLRTSKSVLSEAGLNIRGWVTPYSAMNVKYIPSLKNYYDYGFTIYWDDLHITQKYQDKNTDTCKLWRISLYSDLDTLKSTVDEAIANKGFLTFYGHSADLDNDVNFTTNNLNSLLDYIKLKTLQCECYLLKPCEATDYYFHVRHSDWLELRM